MTKKELTKREAEIFFELTGTYTEKDLSKAYRAKVSMYHPDLAAARGIDEEKAEEMMVIANAANTLLKNAIAASANGTVKCEPAVATTPKANRTYTYSASSAEQRPVDEEAKARAAEVRAQQEAERKARQEQRERETAEKMKNIRYRTHVRKVPAGQYVDSEGFVRTAYKEEYYTEAYIPGPGIGEQLKNIFGTKNMDSTREKFRNDSDMPDFLAKKYKKVENFPYRLVFAGINALIGVVLFIIWTWYARTLGSPTLAAITLFILIIAVADLITGCITKPIRRARLRQLDRQLVRWRNSKNVSASESKDICAN